MKKPNLNKIIENNLDKIKFQSKAQPSLPTDAWTNKYKEGGAVPISTGMLTNIGSGPKVPTMRDGGLGTNDACPEGYYKHSLLGCIPIPNFKPVQKEFQLNASNKKDSVEKKINKYLDNPMKKAEKKAEELGEKWYNPHTKKWELEQIDNIRHPMAGRYTAEAIANKFPGFMQYTTPIPKIVGFVGANALGVGHEISEPNFSNHSWFDTIGEAGEDAFNNMVGAGIGSLPFISDDTKSNMIKYLSDNNLIPDGQGKRNSYKDGNGIFNIYKKKNGGDISIPNLQEGNWTDKYKF